MAPHGAHPLYVGLVLRFTQALEVTEDVFSAHLAKSPKEVAGVVEHDARIFALGYEVGNPLPHAFVAPSEDRGVVVVAFTLILEHTLKVTDGTTIVASWHAGLVHVKGAGEPSSNF